MMKQVFILVASVLAAADFTEATTVETFFPAAFQGRNDSVLATMYTFQQQECIDNSFADAVSDDILGGFNYSSSWSSSVKCPSHENSAGNQFSYSSNGLHSQGFSYSDSTVEDWAIAYPNITALRSAFSGAFTIEIWFRPTDGTALSTDGSNFIIMEIGSTSSDTSGSYYLWSKVSQFDLQIRYLYSSSGGGQFYAAWTGRRNAAGDTRSAEDYFGFGVNLVADEIYCLTITSTGELGTAFQGYLTTISSMTTVEGSVGLSYPLYSNFSSGSVVYIGSSPIALSTAYTTYYSFPGDILLFALHTAVLNSTSLTANLNAALPNSRPVMTTTVSNNTVNEDQYGMALNLTDIVYDFDEDYFGKSAPTMILTGYVNETSEGLLGSNVTVDGTVLDLDTDLPVNITDKISYNARANLYGMGFELLFSAVDEYAYATTNATLEMIVTPKNDNPVALASSSVADTTSQSTYSEFVFKASDPDCPSTSSETAAYYIESCQLYGVNKTFHIVTPGYDYIYSPLGKFYLPDSDGSCEGGLPDPDSDSRILTSTYYNATVNGKGTVSLTLCFEACLGLSTDSSIINPCPADLNNQSTLGDVTLSFYVEDLAGATSSSRNLTTTVTSVLDADVGDVAMIIEGNATVITLNGTDNYCEQSPVPDDCDERVMTFELMELIPESQGVLYEDANLTTPAEVGYKFNGTIYLAPAEYYFSIDSWPICSAGTTYSFTTCADTSISLSSTDGTEYPFTCTGPYCGASSAVPTGRYQYFTTTDLENNTMGVVSDAGCVNGDSNGCPILINYKVLLENQGLESNAADGASIYVRNVNDVPWMNAPITEMTSISRNTYYALTDDDGNPFQIGDEDADTRTIDLVIQTTDSSYGKVSVSSTLSYDSNNFDIVRGSGVSNSGSADIRVKGTKTEINKFLSVLRYRTTASSSTSDSIVFTIFDVSRNGDTSNSYTELDGVSYYSVTTTLSITIKASSSDTGVHFTLTTVAIYAIVGISALCCIGFCVGVICAIAACAQRGSRGARWILNNLLCSKIERNDADPDAPDSDMKSAAAFTEAAVHAEHARMTKVIWCAKLLHCLCPCCVKFRASNDMVPDEEAMMVAVTDRLREERASQHLPSGIRAKSKRLVIPPEDLFNWERHIYHDEESGRDIPYYFNSRTNESSWHRPKVRDQSAPPDEV